MASKTQAEIKKQDNKLLQGRDKQCSAVDIG